MAGRRDGGARADMRSLALRPPLLPCPLVLVLVPVLVLVLVPVPVLVLVPVCLSAQAYGGTHMHTDSLTGVETSRPNPSAYMLMYRRQASASGGLPSRARLARLARSCLVMPMQPHLCHNTTQHTLWLPLVFLAAPRLALAKQSAGNLLEQLEPQRLRLWARAHKVCVDLAFLHAALLPQDAGGAHTPGLNINEVGAERLPPELLRKLHEEERRERERREEAGRRREEAADRLVVRAFSEGRAAVCVTLSRAKTSFAQAKHSIAKALFRSAQLAAAYWEGNTMHSTWEAILFIVPGRPRTS